MDPFGYAALTGTRWAFVQEVSGVPDRQVDPHASRELKAPPLWLTHAEAMSQAAVAVLNHEPQFKNMPLLMRGICDGQYCAAGLMLVGYSLEICLKAMLLIQKGTDEYTAEERAFRHHNLVRLAGIVPGLTEKDKAILEVLTHFVRWAGRYPDPGSGEEANTDLIFERSEKHQITSKDVFTLASRIMAHVQRVIEEADGSGTAS